MAEDVSPVTNEHVLEIRYKANPKVLDHRGTWAEKILSHMELQHWRIVENRIDIFSEDQKINAFIGFRNGGMSALDTPTMNFFPDKAIKLFKFLFKLEEFGDPLMVDRFGVRSKFCTPFNGSFDELRDRYASRFLVLTEDGRTAIGKDTKLVDTGGPLNFTDSLGNFNTMSGPMPQEQFPKFFRRDEGFPDVGLYFDIDYWLRPRKLLDGATIINRIRDFANEAWERHERVRDLIMR